MRRVRIPRPTVVLAKTKKGYGVAAAESKMTAHQQKKLDLDALRLMRDRFDLPLSDDDLEAMRFYRPLPESKELQYLRERRAALGGNLPARRTTSRSIPVPALTPLAQFAIEADGKEMSTTMALVRIFNALVRDKELGPRIVPIVADEARTFDGQHVPAGGHHAPQGQTLRAARFRLDAVLSRSQRWQLLEEGINEAGALAS